MAEELIFTRTNPMLRAREQQLELNRLAALGGTPYVKRRLWRAPNESELSWAGKHTLAADPLRGCANASFELTGRRERTTLLNDAGRIVGKIQQYLFKKPVSRPGIDPGALSDIGGRGVDALSFWMSASETFTTQQWLWVRVSNERGAQTLADIGPKPTAQWSLFPPRSVPDWEFLPGGELSWLITETEENASPSPFEERRRELHRTLYVYEGPGAGVSITRYLRRENGSVQALSRTMTNLSRIPFVLIGRPSFDPWWFDDVEHIQAQLLNLDSLHIANLERSVFPQLVISEATFDSLQTRLAETYGAERGDVVVQVIKELVRGADSPIVETAQESGVTRYITPNASDLAAIPTEISRKRSLLFEMTGLSLFNKESRQAQTAESKAFDNLDSESTLRNRALLMQAAEEKLVELTRELDPGFPHYAPVWPTEFDVVDTKGEMEAVAILANLPDTTPSMRKLAMAIATRLISAHGGDSALVEAANAEIRSYGAGSAALEEL